MTEKNANWLKYHFAGYFSLILILLPILIFFETDLFWALLILLNWGGVLALHVAWVMGLFDVFKQD